MENKTVIIIAGPTASGKTALAMELASQLQTSIISADSRQCYIELDIGVARPTPQQLQSIPHYFIASHHLTDEVNAMIFEQLALDWSERIFLKNDAVIMAGGTGLYINAFCDGLDNMPAVDKSIRDDIQAGYEAGGIGWLQEQVKKHDPAFYAEGEILNPRRLMRALEVSLGSGQSILSFRSKQKKQRPFRILKIGTELPREELKQNIRTRVDRMMQLGLPEEVRSLMPFRSLNALQTVGYREIIQYIDGSISLDEAVEKIKTNTWQYARRQMTWFRKDPSIHWIHPEDDQALKKIIKS